MVWVKNYKNKPVYICGACGFGYEDVRLALACEDYCTEHKCCSPEISKKAVMRP